MSVALPEGEIYNRLKEIDTRIITIDEMMLRATRELHVGVVMMMPDAALQATETQFILPMHYAAGLRVFPHFISHDGIERGDGTQKGSDKTNYKKYVKDNYITFDQAKEIGLDALIITGATPSPKLHESSFYPAFSNVVDWAKSDEGPTSTLFSCLATHAYMYKDFGAERTKTGDKKLLGVFDHKVRNKNHPLTHGMDTSFYIPHSRNYQITEQQFKDAGLNILVDSERAGVHMATSPDDLRIVLWQGHPEYSDKTLLIETQRDWGVVLAQHDAGDLEAKMEYPYNYFKGEGLNLMEEHKKAIESGDYYNQQKRGKMSRKKEDLIMATTPNRWTSSYRALISNWLAAVYEKTGEGRHEPFMEGVDRNDVFGLNIDEPE